MSPPTLTALVVAKNEARELPGCLAALRWASQIIVVVDATSVDATESIARRLADLAIVRRFDDFASQRNAGLAHATGDWILSVDADERVTPELRTEIERSISHAQNTVAYRVPIRSNLFGHTFRYSGTQNDRPVRLFRREAGRWIGRVHETIELKGHVDTLSHYLTHTTHETIQEFLIKMNLYTDLEALQLYQSGTRPRWTDLTLTPLWTFARVYLKHQGFRDGAAGFLFCVLSAISTMVRGWKLRELYSRHTAQVPRRVPVANSGVQEAA
jgi:hypothetical protein